VVEETKVKLTKVDPSHLGRRMRITHIFTSPIIAIDTTIIAVAKNGLGVIFGWKQAERAPNIAISRSKKSARHQYIDNDSDYSRCYGTADSLDFEFEWIDEPTIFAQNTYPNGMPCAKCGDWNMYAVPNRGSEHYCYTCK
jgi:hypothetical protein